jgi:hypothetical protein
MTNPDFVTGIIVIVMVLILAVVIACHIIRDARDDNRRKLWISTILAGPEATAALAADDRRFALMLAASKANLANVGPNRVW